LKHIDIRKTRSITPLSPLSNTLQHKKLNINKNINTNIEESLTDSYSSEHKEDLNNLNNMIMTQYPNKKYNHINKITNLAEIKAKLSK